MTRGYHPFAAFAESIREGHVGATGVRGAGSG